MTERVCLFALPPDETEAAMCPQRFVPSSYDAEKLLALQQAFDEAWELIATPLRNEELREKLAKAIVAHASNGISNPDELRDLSLKSLREIGVSA